MIFGVDEGDLLHAVVAGEGRRALKAGGIKALVLCPGDLAEHHARRKDLLIQTHIAQNVLDDTLGIARVVDREAAVIAEPFDVAPQDAAARRVERHGPHVERFLPEHVRKAVFELVCRLVCEGDGDDAPRSDRAERRERIGVRAVRLRLRFQPVLKKEDVSIRHIVRNFGRIIRAAKGDEVCNAVDEHRRLAAARACQKQQRPLCCQSGLKLHIVEV